MGNNSSQSKEILAKTKTKLEDYENIPDLYRIINPKGGGELVDVAWLAHKSGDMAQIDDYIRREVFKYLLNGGQGRMIWVDEIIQRRNNEAQLKSTKLLRLPKEEKPEKMGFKARVVCFDLDKRGRNGETLLHLCFSNGSFLHMLIARRLLEIFPNMVNDICINDEHYGQTVLHMAIVNEDPYMVQYLLACGAEVNERACGRFFIPDDQKNSRHNLDIDEFPTLPAKTNYQCFSYFGEYPLSFAAILNQEECVRLLIAHGADMNRQDSNGNTVLHMCVINNNIEMFKLLVEHDANLDIKNRQGFTPLTLAAELCREEIFFFVLESKREVYWVYANISCAAYPLKDVDTISETGNIDTKSALHLILNKNTEEHLELLEGFLTDLLHKKWTTFVRFRFFLETIVYMLYFVLNAVTLFLKRIYYDHLMTSNCTQVSDDENHLKDECECAYRDPSDDLRYPRTAMEIIVLLYTGVLILIHLNEIYVQRWQFFYSLLSNPTRFLYFFALISIVIILPMRFSCNTYGEDVLVVLVIIFLSINTMYYARGFKFITTFVYNFHMILRNNVVRFFLIYILFLFGFSQTFYIIYSADPPPQAEKVFNSIVNSFLHTFVLTVGEVVVDFELYRYVSSYVIFGSIFTIIYLIIGTLVLVNILIAMMDHTQEITNDRPNEWLRQEAERQEAKHDKEIFQESIRNVEPAHKD